MADAGYGQEHGGDQAFYQANYQGYGYGGSENQPAEAAGYDMGGGVEQFPQEQPFGQFDYSQEVDPNAMGSSNMGIYASENPYVQPAQTGYSGSIMTPDPLPSYTPGNSDNFEDEPPLMEELGINFDHIRQKTVAVLNPLVHPETSVMQDTDLAGPLVFCLALGGALLLSGKVHFGYIYGIGLVGCLAMYALLNLMSVPGVSASCTVSVLGYCLLPMVLLSFLSVLISLQGLIGILATCVTVMWCSVSASKLFVSALSMTSQQLLVAYPCALVYGVFALITVF